MPGLAAGFVSILGITAGTTAATIATGVFYGIAIGALVGGVSAALKGGNILKGALVGALVGGVTGGIGASLMGSAGLAAGGVAEAGAGAGVGEAYATSMVPSGILGPPASLPGAIVPTAAEMAGGGVAATGTGFLSQATNLFKDPKVLAAGIGQAASSALDARTAKANLDAQMARDKLYLDAKKIKGLSTIELQTVLPTIGVGMFAERERPAQARVMSDLGLLGKKVQNAQAT
jgi:hypothetical protein